MNRKNDGYGNMWGEIERWNLIFSRYLKTEVSNTEEVHLETSMAVEGGK